MQHQVQTIPRPLWASPAGKTRIAKQLAALLPPHQVYVEPFAGSAAVFFAKASSPVEVLGDADADIVRAFRAAQSLSEEDLAVLRGASWVGKREQFDSLQKVDDATGPRDWLYAFLYRAKFSFLKRRRHFDPTREGAGSGVARGLEAGVTRLRKTVIEAGDYQAIVEKYDGPETVFFFDPPYCGSNMGVGEGAFDEERFLEVLKGLQGRFLLTYGAGGNLIRNCARAGFQVSQHYIQRNAPVSPRISGRPLLATAIVTNYGGTLEPPPGEPFAFEKAVAIVKQVPDERYLLGVVLEPDVVDAHGDIYDAETVRGAAHDFMANFRTMGLMHRYEASDSVRILESYILPVDARLEHVTVRKGTWLMAVRIDDQNIWQQVKAGELTGFSIGGKAACIDLEAAVTKRLDKPEDPKMPRRRLVNMQAHEVSLVDAAANKWRYLIAKRRDVVSNDNTEAAPELADKAPAPAPNHEALLAQAVQALQAAIAIVAKPAANEDKEGGQIADTLAISKAMAQRLDQLEKHFGLPHSQTTESPSVAAADEGWPFDMNRPLEARNGRGRT